MVMVMRRQLEMVKAMMVKAEYLLSIPEVDLVDQAAQVAECTHKNSYTLVA